MDMIDILGGILGQKSGNSSASGGGKILKDILGGNSPSQGRTREAAPPSRSDITTQARELEDLLNVAGNRGQSRSGNLNTSLPGGGLQSGGSSGAGRQVDTRLPQSNSPFGSPRQADSPPPFQPSEKSGPFSAPRREPQPTPNAGPKKLSPNDEAQLLVQAMLNAAKCDREISETEQQAIFKQIGDPTPDVLAYLRQEIQKPLDVREFAWSVPVGMEQKVYAISILAMDLKSQAESRYLDELAQGLRLSSEARSEIHRHYGLTDLG
jgi:hypothetical protein